MYTSLSFFVHMCDNDTSAPNLATASGPFDKDHILGSTRPGGYLHELHVISYNAQKS
jgi:hypothetical protein